MHIRERKHGGWFADRNDGSVMGNIKEAEGGYLAILVFENGDTQDLGVYPTLEDAWDAIADAD